MRDENSTTWFWETTGAEITEFFWEANEPNLNFEERTGITFNPVNLWYDDRCDVWSFPAMCQ